MLNVPHCLFLMLYVVMLNLVHLTIIMVNDVTLSVIMVNVYNLNVVSPGADVIKYFCP
jgi:hypothetical protein